MANAGPQAAVLEPEGCLGMHRLASTMMPFPDFRDLWLSLWAWRGSVIARGKIMIKRGKVQVILSVPRCLLLSLLSLHPYQRLPGSQWRFIHLPFSPHSPSFSRMRQFSLWMDSLITVLTLVSDAVTFPFDWRRRARASNVGRHVMGAIERYQLEVGPRRFTSSSTLPTSQPRDRTVKKLGDHAHRSRAARAAVDCLTARTPSPLPRNGQKDKF